MTTEEKTLLAMLTLVAVLVPVALGAVLDWPTWSWLLLAVPMLAALGLVARNIQQRVLLERPWEPHVVFSGHVEQQDQALHTPVPDTALPSAVADYNFRFSATAYWRLARGSRTQHANPAALAANAILGRAQTITEVEQPDKVEVVLHRLASALGDVQRDEASGVETWADHVQLTLPEADQERLRKHSDMRKDTDLWEYEHNYERHKRDYLSGEVLKSTGSAVTWWLARKDHDVEDTVRLIGALAQLSAAANNTEVPELFRHLVPTAAAPGQRAFASQDGASQFPNGSVHDTSLQAAGLPRADHSGGPFPDVRLFANRWAAVLDTLDDFNDERRAHFTHLVARVLEKTGKPDEAHEIRRHFDAPTTNKEPADISEPGEDMQDGPALDMAPPRQEELSRSSPLPEEPEQDGQPQTNEQLRSKQRHEPHN
jgi:hypothetical protein